MATELQFQNPHATAASNIRVKMMKISASYKGMESPYATKEIAKKTLINQKKSIDAPKKQCLCAPTTHAGSFKCRLHRASSAQRASSPSTESVAGGEENFNCRKITQCGNVNSQPQLSRFGRAAAEASDQPAIVTIFHQ